MRRPRGKGICLFEGAGVDALHHLHKKLRKQRKKGRKGVSNGKEGIIPPQEVVAN